jgi:hypothetical protein
MMMLPRLFRPPVFQGNLHRRRYFEGWYMKHVTDDGARVVCFIPGVSLAPSDRHAFVQYIEAGSGKSGYVRYPLEQFTWDRRRFAIRIGPNAFSEHGCRIELADGRRSFSGELEYTERVPYPSRITAPGIMGWYAFVPLMECNHGVVSLTHRVDGALRIDGEALAFRGGRGYIEKDWGSSFPRAWLWIQCNSFAEPEASLMVSIATIPWLGSSFTGFLAVFYLRGTIYLFTSYNGSSLRDMQVGGERAWVELEGPAGSLHLRARRTAASTLEAPASGAMNRSIRESVDGAVELVLREPSGHTLFTGSGRSAGFESEGDIAAEALAVSYASRPSMG